MTWWQIFLIGFCGGLSAFISISALSCVFILIWMQRAPFMPEEEFINDHLARRRYRNGHSSTQEETNS